MARDTATDLTELLTSREREVLDLLRLGLSNRQIAERLDISAAGVRYHISEIIGKLGVRNRYEAAAWPERPPWWLSAAGPVALLWRRAKALVPMKLNSVALAAAVAMVATALAGIGLILFFSLGGGSSGKLSSPADCLSRTLTFQNESGEMTVEELAELVAEAITCPGYALHLSSTGDFEAGPYSSGLETNVWIDMEQALGRSDTQAIFVELQAEGEPPLELRQVSILLSDATYSREEGAEVTVRRSRLATCHGPDHALIDLILRCEGATAEMEITVEREGSYRGRGAVAYVTSGIQRSSDEIYDTTTRVYLDERTYLPLGQTQDGTLDVGTIYRVEYDAPFQVEFVRLDTLPPDFFEPASIGYVEKDPEEPLDAPDRGVPTYWLGREFDGGDGLPALALDAVLGNEIIYRPADDEFGLGIVSLRLHSLAEWDARPARVESPCEETEPIELIGAQATLRRHFHELRLTPGSPCPPPDRFSAVVTFDDAVVEVSAPTTVAGNDVFRSPYDSEAGMRVVVRSLKLRK